MNKSIIIFLIAVSLNIFTITQVQSAEDQLIKIVEAFRHGARLPQYVEENDIQTKTPTGHSPKKLPTTGELSTGGQRQNYLLGKALAEEYIKKKKLIQTPYNISEFFIRSTDVNRTLMSAQSQILGIFDFGSGPRLPSFTEDRAIPPYLRNKKISEIQKWLEDRKMNNKTALEKKFQPIPIHTMPKEDNILLTPFDKTTCPINSDLTKYTQKQENYKEINDHFLTGCKNIAQQLGFDTTTFTNVDKCQNVWDNYIAYLHHYGYINDEIFPKIAVYTKETLQFLEDLSIVNMLMKTGANDFTKKFLRTPFYNYMREEFDMAIEKPSNPLKWGQRAKWDMLSAHQDSLTTYFVALNLTSADCIYEKKILGGQLKRCLIKTDINKIIDSFPKYTANLVIELYKKGTPVTQNENDPQNYYIKIKYNGIDMPVCERNEIQCSYSEFRDRITQNTVNNVEKLCKLKTMPEGFCVDKSTCQKSQYCSADAFTCSNCQLNCEKCSNGNTCDYCVDKFFYREASKLCESKCSINEYPLNRKCESCPDVTKTCTLCKDNADCLQCQKTPADSVICQKCYKQCSKCFNQDSCSSCISKYKWSNKKCQSLGFRSIFSIFSILLLFINLL